MKKILIIANNAGGLFRFRGMLIKTLMEQGNDVFASVPFDNSVPDLEKMGVHIIETSIDRRGINPIKDVKLIFSCLKNFKRVKPDLVITYTIKPNVYGGFIARITNVPYALNITGLGTAFQNNGILRKAVTLMYKLACKKAKVVFFENAENRQIFIDERIVKEEQTCLLNGAGVDLEHFQVNEYPPDVGITRFLFIGRVMKEKGIHELFSAMQMLRDAQIDCVLDVVGGCEEDYTEQIKQCVDKGWLIYHGMQKDVRPFIDNCHCFVLPSWHEGMANTNLESAASGRPVITSNIPGCMEAVVDGKTGYLAERKNAEDLYRVMKKFAELPYEERKAMGLAGRKHMEEVFDKKKVVKATIQALELDK